jgi:tetratricopeptide (TPR) repeat protein
MGELWWDHARAGRWTLVLKTIRADLTQYSIYHRTNTRPLMARYPLEELDLLTIDIDALNETVEQLAEAYRRLGKLDTFPAVLERLRDNIHAPRWHRKITYQQAVIAHLCNDNTRAGYEFAKLGPIQVDEEDVELLQFDLELNGESIPLVDKLKRFDRILELTSSRTDRIHYTAAKGVELMAAGDKAGAISLTSSAIEAARESEAVDPFGSDTALWFCKLLEVAGVAKVDEFLLAEAAQRLEQLVMLPDHWTPLGLGHLHHCLGNVYRANAQWEKAESAYARGFELDDKPIQRVFEATCTLMQGKRNEALMVLKRISVDALDAAERVDHAIAYAAVAVSLRDLTELAQAERLLEATRPSRQYFENQRLAHLLAIERARTAIATGKPVPQSSKFLDWIGSISRWFLIQPNIAGIGINFNTMVDDAVAARRRGHSGKSKHN